MIRLFLLCLLLGIALFSWNTLPDDAVPLFFSRATLTIKRSHPPEAALLPWQKPEEVLPPPDLTLDVEIRDAALLYNQSGWYNLSSPSDTQGVFMVFSAPTMAPISASAQYAPLDVLMIDKEGAIKQIAPKLMLTELTEDIYPKEPVLAFLFMRGGACAKHSIQPGDHVEYKIFKKPPAVLSIPTTPATAPQPVATPLPTPQQ